MAGVYRATRTRSKTNPGSCPPTEANFNPDLPIRITWDGTKPSQYKVEVAYSDQDTYKHDFVECVNNKSACDVYATCKVPAGYEDQMRITVSGSGIAGVVQRTSKKTGCTINYDVRGARP